MRAIRLEVLYKGRAYVSRFAECCEGIFEKDRGIVPGPDRDCIGWP